VADQIQATLVRMGFDGQPTICTGVEACARVEADGPDLVLMDIRLRRGVDAVEKARRLLFQDGPPIVYLAPQPYAAEPWLAGLRPLTAPFSDEQLRSAIELAIHRHDVERSLREAVDLFSVTFDEAPIGMALTSLDDRYLRVNVSLCSILGYTREELTGMRWYEVTHPDDVAAEAELGDRLLAGKIPRIQIGKRYIRKDGGVVEAVLAVSIMRDPDRSPLCKITQIVDVTERRNAEEARRTAEAAGAAEAQAHEVFEQASEGIFITDSASRIMDVNRAACEMFGYPREELLDSPMEDLMPPSDAVRVAFAAVEVSTRGTPGLFEWTALRKDGTGFPVEVSARELSDGRWQSFLRDVTERKRAEQAKDDATRRLMTVLEQCPVGIVVVLGGPGEVEEAKILSNFHARELFGRSLDPKSGIEQFAGAVLTPDGARVSIEDLPSQRALRGETVAPTEFVLRHVDGRHIPIRSSAAALLDGTGRVQGAVVVVEDISSQKERERMRAEWSSLVAHDLRQPLNMIAVRAGMIAKGAPEVAAPLTLISQAVLRLDRMVQDLLDLSRLEVRHMSFDRRRFDLQPLVLENATQLVREDSGRPLVVRRCPGELFVHGDRDRIAQVLENLVTNAIKYGAARTPIEVDLSATERDVSVAIRNEGMGIEPAVLPRIFDRFFRVQDPSHSAIKGVGLGLYIAREIVEAHGGRLTAESTPGATTTFRFTLPRVA
jgi:PAS domain S-box-containing protein